MANNNPEEKYYNKFGPDLNKDFLIQDQSFIADARKFLAERKDFSLHELRDPQEVYDRFIRHMRHTEVNELASYNDLDHVNKLDDAGKAQMGRLYSVWDRMDGEKSSVLDAFKDYGLGIVTAPSTYTSIVTGGAGKLIGAGGALAARLAARKAATQALTKQIRQQQLNISRALPTNLTARSAIKGALGAATVEGAVGASLGYTGEKVREVADITGETKFRWSQPILHGLLGAGLGAPIGGAVGAFSGRRQMAALNLISEATAKQAGRIAAAEKQVVRTVYDLDQKDMVEGAVEIGKDTGDNVRQFYDIYSALMKRNGRDPIDRPTVIRGMETSAKLGVVGEDFTEFTAVINNRTEAEAASSVQSRIAALMMQVLNDAKTYKILDDPKSFNFSTELPPGVQAKDIKVDDSLLDQRFTMIMHKVLQHATSDQADNYVGDLLEKYNLTLGQLTDIYAADLSYAGRLLGVQSSISRAVSKAAVKRFTESVKGIRDTPVGVQRTDDTGRTATEQMQVTFTKEGDAFIDAMEKGQDTLKSHYGSRWMQGVNVGIQGAGAAIGEFDRFTKGFMTIQLATTARNTANATIRAPLYMLTNLLQGSFEYVAASARRTKGDVGNIELKAVEMRKALSRMASPVMFLKHMLDPQTAKAMFHFFSEEFPQEFNHYIRRLADVEGGQSGWHLTAFARKMNALNTFIDNSFKRAIYVTELGQRVGHKRLIQLSREGRFNEISFDNHLGAVNDGLDFTYQTRFTGPGKTERLYSMVETPTGRFDAEGKEIIKTTTKALKTTGAAGTIADTFVKFFSIPIIGSGFIPYPRFVASFLKHTFEYAPFVGMIPLEKFGYRAELPKLGTRLQEKLDARELVKIVNENPRGDDARSILSQYEGGIVGKAWAKKKALAEEPLTTKEELVKRSYDGVGGDKGKRLGFILPGRSGHKVVAQQLSGLSLLYGALQLRAQQGPEAEWYEMHRAPIVGEVAKGQYANAQAFYGVYAPYMLLADVLLRSTNFLTGDDPETIRSWVIADDRARERFRKSARESVAAVALRGDKVDDYLEVAFGQAFKTGQGLAFADYLSKFYQEDPDMASEDARNKFAQEVGDTLAAYMARATVPFGMIKDVLGTVDPLWKEIPDDGEVNPFLIGAYGDAKTLRQALVGPSTIGVMTRAFPKKNIQDPETGETRNVYDPAPGQTERRIFGLPFMALPKGFERGAVSPETTRLLRSEGGIAKQIFGIGAGKYKNELQKEFSRLNMRDPWKLFKRYKNDILDRVAKKYTAPRVEEEVLNTIRSTAYQNADPLQQRELIKSRLREIRNALRDRMEVLIGATTDFDPQDSDIRDMLEGEDGPRKHRQLISHFYELKFKDVGTRNLRALLRKRIKAGEVPEIVAAGFAPGTILSEVIATAKNEDGTLKYSNDQLSLIYRLATEELRKMSSETLTAPIRD